MWVVFSGLSLNLCVYGFYTNPMYFNYINVFIWFEIRGAMPPTLFFLFYGFLQILGLFYFCGNQWFIYKYFLSRMVFILSFVFLRLFNNRLIHITTMSTLVFLFVCFFI